MQLSFKYYHLFLAAAFLGYAHISSCMEKMIGGTLFAGGVISSVVGATLIATPETQHLTQRQQPGIVVNISSTSSIDQSAGGRAYITVFESGEWLKTNTIKGSILLCAGIGTILASSRFLVRKSSPLVKH